jgi:MFS family permease
MSAPDDAATPPASWRFWVVWGTQAVSLMGTEITLLVLPSIAVLGLHASPFQVAALGACSYLGPAVLIVPVGAVIDRFGRRSLMAGADAGRVIVLVSVPIVCASGHLDLVHLYIVALLTGALDALFVAAYQAVLPSLVGAPRLLSANTWTEVSRSAAQVGGPALAGHLIQFVGAPLAVLADAVSYLVSMLGVLPVGDADPRYPGPSTGTAGSGLSRGLRFLLSHRELRQLTAAAAVVSLGFAFVDGIYLVFTYRSLHLSPGQVGVVLSIGSLGTLAATGLVRLMGDRLSCRAGVAWAGITGGVGQLLLPLAGPLTPMVVLVCGRILLGASFPMINVYVATARQRATPAPLLGRVNALARALCIAALAMGYLVGGLVAARFGIVSAILAGGAIFLSSAPVLLLGRQPARSSSGRGQPAGSD